MSIIRMRNPFETQALTKQTPLQKPGGAVGHGVDGERAACAAPAGASTAGQPDADPATASLPGPATKRGRPWWRWLSLGRAHMTFDGNAHCVDVSARFCRLVGRERASLIGLSVREVFSLPGGELLLPFHRMAGSTDVELYRCHWAQGLHVQGRADALLDLDAEPLSGGRWRVWVREASVAPPADRLAVLAEAVLRQTPEGVLITDAKRRISALNPAFARMSGYSETQLLGQDVNKVLQRVPQRLTPAQRMLPAEVIEAQAEPFVAMDERGTPCWRGEVRLSNAMGHVLNCWQNAHVMYDWLGRPQYHVLMLHDIGPMKRHEAALQHLAYHDALTGLPNRLLFANDLSRSLERARRHSQRLALLFLDLDHFKRINDVLGHAQGDRLLCEVARRLKELVRAEDSVARLGGDEFVVAMQDLTHTSDAEHMAAKIIQSLARPVDLPGDDVSFSVSVGIAVYPEHGQTPEALLMAADGAMYRAKRMGRSAAVVYAPHLDAAPGRSKDMPPIRVWHGADRDAVAESSRDRVNRDGKSRASMQGNPD